ncbi:MAG: oligosaccharide flippase family protein [Patescibacteria group bacterium]|nr:oligosaccharide flippase family protein [Patescibacteria group bacterium]
MFNKFLNFIKKSTSKNILINSVGNYTNVFFTAFFAFLLVRIMSPSEYGILSVLLGIAYVLANILDFGTTASIYSYLPLLIEKKRNKAFVFLKTVFFFQTILSLIVVLFFLIFFPYFDKIFFKTNVSIFDLYLTTFSAIFFIWQNYIINSLNAVKKFLYSNIILNLSNIIKTLFIFILYKINFVNVGSIIFTFGILGPSIFFLILIFEKYNTIKNVLKAKIEKEEFKFGYTISFFIASQFFNLALRMDLFLLSFFYPQSPQIGYYGLAQKIILTVLASITAITQVLSPNFSKINSKTQAKKEFKNGFLYLLIPAFLFIILYFTPEWIFNLFFTKKYQETIIITKLLGLSFILYVFFNLPYLFILYTAKKIFPILITNIVFFLIITFGCFFLIPKFGVFGPIIVIGFGFFCAFLIALFFALKEYQKLPNN